QVFATTARRNRDLADVVRILPTTLDELRPTLVDVRALSREAGPVVRALRPAASDLAPALSDASTVAPKLRTLFGDIDRTITVSKTALPSTTRVVDALHPVARLLPPTLEEALPVVQYLDLYKDDILSHFSLLGSALQASMPAFGRGPPIHYLRSLVPFTSESLVAWDKREGTNRHNPYFLPRALDKLAQGLDSFDCGNLGNPSAGDPAPRCVVQKPLQF